MRKSAQEIFINISPSTTNISGESLIGTEHNSQQICTHRIPSTAPRFLCMAPVQSLGCIHSTSEGCLVPRHTCAYRLQVLSESPSFLIQLNSKLHPPLRHDSAL